MASMSPTFTACTPPAWRPGREDGMTEERKGGRDKSLEGRKWRGEDEEDGEERRGEKRK